MKSEKVIIKAVLNGETEKYSLIVKEHSEKIFALAKSMLKNTEDAEEITQNVFLKAFQSLETFRGESKFSSFLYRICYNECINMLRTRKITVSIDDIGMEDITINEDFYLIKHEEQKKFLSLALNKLNVEESMMLTMFYLEEQSCQEIVKMTGISLSNVKVKLHRARKSLAQTLNLILDNEVKDLY